MHWGTKRHPCRPQSPGGRMAQELAASVRSAVPCARARWWQGAGCCWQQHAPSTGCSPHPPLNASRDVRNGMSWVLGSTLALTTCYSVLLQRLQLLGQAGGMAQPWGHPGFHQGEQSDLPQQPYMFCLAFPFQNNHIWEKSGASAPDTDRDVLGQTNRPSNP